MSINKMLIDATHPEETRVVVLRDSRVEEFDYESAARKLLRGSIYLAKITRVEPSLQASFVDYGGNRHGFLAFAEIHPDYYQIPHADKLALLEQESRDLASFDDDLEEDDSTIEPTPEPAANENTGDETDAEDDATGTPEVMSSGDEPTATPAEDYDFEANAIDVTELIPEPDVATGPADSSEEIVPHASRNVVPLEAAPSSEETLHSADSVASDTDSRTETDATSKTSDAEHFHITADQIAPEAAPERNDTDGEEETDDDDAVEIFNDDNDDDDTVEAIAGEDEADSDDEADDAPARRHRQQRPRRRTRQYKIQEVIKRRQIVLIQVVKEERGNKGAALTTYLSLAGRYTVLMPNTARGGGISRKITNVQDRKRLKAIAQELEVPEGMGLIIRTAGAARTKQEIKRDFEYLLRLWENVRSLTLESTAPSLVYEEGNLIKRSIRDLYTKEIDEVIVAGEQAHKEAKSFMRMLMPSHAKNVVKHEDSQSLFAKYRIEQQLNAMFSPNVQLKSGGYLVINQTEALVAIDVNSGKSTREFSIEETALNTNLEAAEELSRQLKLRDLAGLIVVDFIDMEEKRNNRAVERRLKDSLRADRARIQVGRISHFGLLEMSRQRLRTGVLEGSTMPCDHCQGSGIIRSIESVSLAVLRGLEDTLVAGKMASCVASCSGDVALYLLNQKRTFIQELEERYGVVIHVRSSAKQQGANFLIEPLHDAAVQRPRSISRDAVNIDTAFNAQRVADNDDEKDDSATEQKPRRRRRRRGRRDENREADANRPANHDVELTEEERTVEQTGEDDSDSARAQTSTENGEERPRRSRRRGRRGGRRHRDQRAVAEDASVSGTEPLAHSGEDNDTSVQSATTETMNGSASPAELEQRETESSVPLTESTVAEPDEVYAATASSGSDLTASFEPEAATDSVTAEHSEEANNTNEAVSVEATDSTDTKKDEASLKTEHAPAATETEEKSELKEASEPLADRSARSQPVAGEPVIQRVVVSPNGQHANSSTEDLTSIDGETTETDAKPSRKGWWQRQFGG